MNLTQFVRVALLSTTALSASFAGTMGDIPQEYNWYVGGRGGVNVPFTNNQEGLKTTYNTGYNAAGEVGYWFGNFALEAEGGYLSSNMNKITGGTQGVYVVSQSGSTGLAYGMINGYYGFTMGSNIVPYVGVGVGGGSLNPSWNFDTNAVNVNNNLLYASNSINESQAVFVYQAIAGLAYSFNPSWSVSLDYRFLGTSLATAGGTTRVINASSNAVLLSTPNSQQIRFNTNLINAGVDYHF